MNASDLEATARDLVAERKGILAADESAGTIQKRLASIGVESTEHSRRAWRQLLFTTPGIDEYISGVILFDETIRQHADDGQRLVDLLTANGVLPGIKVDKGAKPLVGSSSEKVTEGLDGLRARLAEYCDLGARFTKWRAVIAIGPRSPQQPRHRRQCRCPRPLRCSLARGRARAHRRTRSAHGRVPRHPPLPGSHLCNPAPRLPVARRAERPP